MDNSKPVQLPEKIDYLNQKIFLLHSQIRKSDDIELRLNFQQFIDTCIREIIAIKDQSSPRKKSTDSIAKSEIKYSTLENQKLEFEKKLVNYQMKQLENRQLQMQYQTMKLKLYNKQKQNQRLEYEKAQIRMENTQELKRLADKNKFLEQEIEKIAKLNKAQEQQIKNVKQQRNRAEARQLQIQQKYDDDIGKLEKFADKKPRYIDRTTQGLKCTHFYTNIGPNPKTNKIILLKLPTIIQVNKLVYGVLLGVQVNSKQILYYDKVQLFQKQLTQIDLENESLVLTYRRRKQNVKIVLDQYVVRTSQVVVMLYGKGDSIIVHDDVKNGGNTMTR